MVLGVEAGSVKQWSDMGRAKTLELGTYIWHQDDPAGVGAYLVSGVLGVEKVNARGDRVVFTELRQGAIFGEMSCLDGQPHSASVKALVDSEIRLFTAQDFEDMLVEDPQRLRNLLKRQNDRLRKLTDKLLLVGTEPVVRRLTYWLCEQREESIAVTHHDLAAQLATTRESVSKALGQLRKKGLVTSSRGRITIPDKAELAATLGAFD